jgi:hypothetical protein
MTIGILVVLTRTGKVKVQSLLTEDVLGEIDFFWGVGRSGA